MSEYEVLGGHDNAEFRQHDDGIDLYSTEEDEDGDEIGLVGTLSTDEMEAVGNTLDDVFNTEGDAEAEAPDLDDMEMGQHPLGMIVFVHADDESKGAVFGDPQDIIDAANALDE